MSSHFTPILRFAAGLALTAATTNATTPPVLVVGGADSCTVPDPIAGLGTFAFDNSAATVGTQGQAEPLCVIFGTPVIDKDVWFVWTAPVTGPVTLSTCGMATVDTKVAVYAGTGCPAGPALACDDDTCGAQSQITWAAVAGSSYTIQLGVFSATPGGTGSFSISALTPANDECATATPIAGAGPHPFDTTGATTGVDGQAETICFANGSTAIERDVWFVWTAPFTGVTRLDLCGLTTDDTKVSVHTGTCAPSGTALSCNDDACGVVSSLSFEAVGGTSYRIQLGVRPGLGDAIGVFTLTGCPAPPNDNAGSGVPVVNNRGTFDNRCATGSTTCTPPPNTPTKVSKGVFYSWTAPSDPGACDSNLFRIRMRAPADGFQEAPSGAVSIGPTGGTSRCGGMSLDGAGAALFQADPGSTQEIEMGAPDEDDSEGTAIFCIQCCGACTITDATSDLGAGVGNGGQSAWLQRCGFAGQVRTVSGVRVAWGSPTSPLANRPPNGTPARVAVWEDPNDDGDPADAVLLIDDAVFVSSSGTDVLVTEVLSSPVVVTGVYFVGAAVDQVGGREPTPIDASECSRFPLQSYLFGMDPTPVDFVNLGANTTPPFTVFGTPNEGAFLLDSISVLVPPATAFCFGDGTGTACPCANNGLAGNGCANSINPSGANLAATGVPSISADTIVLAGSGMPSSTCLYFQGTSQSGAGLGTVFGDGLRCAGGSVIRLGTKTNVAGTSQYPSFGDLSVSVKGSVVAGNVRTYQTWYRNAAAFCTPSNFNLSNGVSITWSP